MALLLAVIVDADAIWAGVAAIAAGLAYFDAPLRERLRYTVILTLLGAAIVAAAVVLAGSTLADVLVIAGIMFVITIVQSLGPPFISGGFLLGAVTLVAVLAAPVLDALPSAALYLAGGAVAMAVIALGATLGDKPRDPPPTGALEDVLARFVDALSPTAPAFAFAAVRAVAVGASVYLAQIWFDDRWLWMVVPTFILIVPTWDLAWPATLKRLAGTLLAVAGFSLISLISDAQAYQVSVFLAATFVALTFIGTGTVSTVTWWTVFAFSLAWLLDEEFALTEAAGERVLSTLAGSGIALLAVALLQRLRRPDAEATEV